MANNTQDLKWRLSADAKNFKRGISEAETSLGKFQKSTTSMFKNIGIGVAAAFSVNAIKNFARTSVDAANVEMQAQNKLLISLKGRQDITRNLIDLASQLQKKTLFGDEETVNALANLSVYVKEEEQLRKLIPLVQDLATAKGMDLASAADLVGKSIGTSTNALKRQGIEINGAVGSAERLESAINGLTKAFEGQAQSAAKTGTGSITQMKNAYSDLQEQVGKLIINWQSFLATSGVVNGLIGETSKMLTIMSADFNFFERYRSQFESQEKTYQRALLKLEEGAKKVQRAFYDMAQDAIKPDDPLMVSMRELLASVKALGGDVNDKLIEIKGPPKEIKTAYAELTEKIAELEEKRQDLALVNKDVSDITAQINGLKEQKSAVDDLLKSLEPKTAREFREEMQKAFDLSVETRGQMAPTFSDRYERPIIAGESQKEKAKYEPIDTTQLADMTGKIEANLLKVENAERSLQATTIDIGREIEGVFQNMAVGIGESLGNMIAGVEGYDNAGNMVIGVMADLAVQVGQIAVGVGVATLGIKKALESLNPAVAIAAGVALIALGTAAKGALSKAAGGGGGSYNSGVYDTRSISSQKQMAGLQANAMRVEIVGETSIKNRDIYIAYKNAESNRKIKT